MLELKFSLETLELLHMHEFADSGYAQLLYMSSPSSLSSLLNLFFSLGLDRARTRELRADQLRGATSAARGALPDAAAGEQGPRDRLRLGREDLQHLLPQLHLLWQGSQHPHRVGGHDSLQVRTPSPLPIGKALD